MSVFRIRKNNNFVVMDKTPLNDDRLSWKAKGIIAYMLSKPDDWIFYLDEVMKHSTDGERAFRSGLDELKEYGYVKREPVREGQRIVRWETVVYENPLLCGFVHVQDEDVQSVHVQNVPPTKNDITKNDSTNNELTKNDDIYTLYEFWNEQGIINHRRMTEKMKRHTKARLKDYSIDEIKEAITNYKKVLESNNHYWTHKWTYEDFMKPSNVIKFLNEANPLENYKKGGFDDGSINGGGNARPREKGQSYEDAIRQLKADQQVWARN